MRADTNYSVYSPSLVYHYQIPGRRVAMSSQVTPPGDNVIISMCNRPLPFLICQSHVIMIGKQRFRKRLDRQILNTAN